MKITKKAQTPLLQSAHPTPPAILRGGWLDALGESFTPLVKAMQHDTRAAPYLCTHATRVLVQVSELFTRGHFRNEAVFTSNFCSSARAVRWRTD